MGAGVHAAGPGLMGFTDVGLWTMGSSGSPQAWCDAMSRIEGRLAFIKAAPAKPGFRMEQRRAL